MFLYFKTWCNSLVVDLMCITCTKDVHHHVQLRVCADNVQHEMYGDNVQHEMYGDNVQQQLTLKNEKHFVDNDL